MYIGIITWYYGANYGALAQSIALYNTIKMLGHTCVLINYKPKKYLSTIKNSNLPSWRELYKIKRIFYGLQKIKKLTTTEYFNVTKRVYSADDINKLKCDCIVLGSDAIFNIKHPLCDPVFWGVGISCKKITYSPSCEFLEPNYKLPNDYISSIKEMTTLSVRDINTYSLLRANTNKIPVITLDPTFLFDFKNMDKRVCNDKYILFYSFSTWNEYKDMIKDYAKSKGLMIISIGDTKSWADKSIENADIEEWVTSFRHAEFVITDSFHGTVFSLKNNKQIVLCGRQDKKAKIESLLNQFDISLDIYNGEQIDDYFLQNTIDYSIAAEKIKLEIDKSMKYLAEALD